MPDPFRVRIVFEFSEYERELVAEYLRRIELRKGVPELARRTDLRVFIRDSVNARWLRMGDDLAELDNEEKRKHDAEEAQTA